jgi:hypothetical protein
MCAWRMALVMTAGLMLPCASGCRLLERGPTDEEVREAVRKSPPSPPTLGPTYLSEVTSVEVQDRGRYNGDGHYWAVRVHVKGNAKIKITSPFQLGLVSDPKKAPSEAVDFAEEARLTKDDFAKWRVSYNYDASGPRWRLEDRGPHHRAQAPGSE